VNVDSDYDRRVNVQDNPEYEVRKPNADEIRIQKLIVLYQMTSLGAPCVYYGEEAGMWGADDPDERKPMLWRDLRYDSEASHPFGKPRPADTNVFNKELFEHYQALIHLRKQHTALSLGEIRPIITNDERDIYSFLRHYEKDQILVVINNNTVGQEIALPEADPVASLKWETLFASQGVTVTEHGRLFTIPPKSGIILKAIQ
jgi:glycosidase